ELLVDEPVALASCRRIDTGHLDRARRRGMAREREQRIRGLDVAKGDGSAEGLPVGRFEDGFQRLARLCQWNPKLQARSAVRRLSVVEDLSRQAKHHRVVGAQAVLELSLQNTG